GSIHRDIKPSNIMWNSSGRLYLLDFGAVKYATTAGGSKVSTSIYSLGFAPPEQVSGDEVYPSTDLYALAVTCIMLLTGKQPPELFNAYNNSWKWQSYVQTSQYLADVLDKMLLPMPDQRFQSATEVLEALVVRLQPPPPQPQPKPSSNTLPPPVPASSSQPIRQKPTVQPFSILELLGSAAFTGCEGALLAIALFSLPIPAPLNAALWLVIALGLVFAQSRRLIEKVDLLILAGITFAVVGFLPTLHAVVVGLSLGSGFLAVAVTAVFGALSAIAITALFRLIYKLLTNIL
ncbi:MAG: protein kinase, partial [Phormidesmis sp. CAN_BIN36]|nr:protein kinase [Phormidesmis sp. CAN_BIN36]